VTEVLRRTSQDTIARQRLAYQEQRAPHFLTFGPKTRHEFWHLFRLRGGSRV
jgi:uncharacterized protein